MAIADFTEYKAKLENPGQQMDITKASVTVVAGRQYSLWTAAPFGGSAPGAAAAPTRATAGALGQQNGGALQLRLIRAQLAQAQAGVLMLADRLSHQSGLSGTVTTGQTTNLPTAALTRYTSGAGVIAALDIYTQIGTTSTTVTASYTNEAGTAARTSQATLFGATGFREASRSIILPLQQGDSGVRSVESVTVLATTGTAGNFGVTLYRPLLIFPLSAPNTWFDINPLLGGGSNMPEIIDDACLYWLYVGNTTASGILQASVSFEED